LIKAVNWYPARELHATSIAGSLTVKIRTLIALKAVSGQGLAGNSRAEVRWYRENLALITLF